MRIGARVDGCSRAVAVSSLSLVVSIGLPAPSDRESWYNRRMGQGHDGMSLHEACYQGRIDVVAQLLASGANPNEPADPTAREWVSCAGSRPRPLNCVAIAWAMTENHVEIARLLIEHGAVVDDSVLRDHTIEMVGGTADSALRRILEAAHSR